MRRNRTYSYWIEDIETASRAELARIQNEKLKRILHYCESRSEFYRTKFKNAGVSISDVQNLHDIGRLPLTSREEVVQNQNDKGRLGGLMCTDFREPGQTIGLTGVKFSASGHPIRVIISVEDAASQGRLGARGLTAAGIRVEDYLYVMDFPKFNHLYMHIGLGSMNLGSKNLFAGMERGERNTSIYTRLYPPGAVYVSPTYGKLITQLLKKTGKRYPIHSVLGWMEPGYSVSTWKERIRQMWMEVSDQRTVTVCDVYGMVEVGLMGFECTAENGLHGFEDSYIYEIIDPDTGDSVPAGKEGELVITHLEREGMPLIRYRTGDITTVELEPCPCGRTHLRLMGIKGRLEQSIKVNGRKVYQGEIEQVMGRFESYSGEFNVFASPGKAVEQLNVNILKDGATKSVANNLEGDFSKALNVPVKIHLKTKEELVIFVHRSQKIIHPESWDRLRKEATDQLRAET